MATYLKCVLGAMDKIKAVLDSDIDKWRHIRDLYESNIFKSQDVSVAFSCNSEASAWIQCHVLNSLSQGFISYVERIDRGHYRALDVPIIKNKKWLSSELLPEVKKSLHGTEMLGKIISKSIEYHKNKKEAVLTDTKKVYTTKDITNKWVDLVKNAKRQSSMLGLALSNIPAVEVSGETLLLSAENESISSTIIRNQHILSEILNEMFGGNWTIEIMVIEHKQHPKTTIIDSLFSELKMLSNNEKADFLSMLTPTIPHAEILAKLISLNPVYRMPKVKKGDTIFHPIAGKKEVVEADEKWIYFYGNGNQWKCDRDGYIDGDRNKPRSVWLSFQDYAKEMGE